MHFNAQDRRLEGKTLLRQVQLAQLYLLNVIDEICKKHGIRYFLAYGTLLGCMRHGGFIPWDDDLDVAMPMDDYRRFLKIAHRELPENLMLQTPATVPGCFEMFAKIRDLSSLAIEAHTDVTRPAGIYVDIFPYEPFPRFPKRCRDVISKGLSLTWRRSRLHRVANHRFVIGVFISGIKAAFWSFAHLLLRMVVFASRYVMPTIWHVLPESGGTPSRHEISDADLFPLRKGAFEDGEYPIPGNADAVLAGCYGDWRTPPPPESRKGHHSSIFIPVQTMGFWWTQPHSSLTEVQRASIEKSPSYLFKI